MATCLSPKPWGRIRRNSIRPVRSGTGRRGTAGPSQLGSDTHGTVNRLRGTGFDEISTKPFSYFGENGLKRFGIRVKCARGLFWWGLPMLTLKVIAVFLGAGMLVSLFAGELGPDLLLAITVCLS